MAASYSSPIPMTRLSLREHFMFTPHPHFQILKHTVTSRNDLTSLLHNSYTIPLLPCHSTRPWIAMLLNGNLGENRTSRRQPRKALPNLIIPVTFCIRICFATVMSLVMVTWILTCRRIPGSLVDLVNLPSLAFMPLVYTQRFSLSRFT